MSHSSHQVDKVLDFQLQHQFSSIQISPSVVSNSLWPNEPRHTRPPCPSPTPSVHPTQFHRVSDAIQPSQLLSSPSPPASIFPSIRVFSNESALCIRWQKYWSFSFNISPSKEHPGMISFRMDWLDLLAVQGTLKSLLQHHSSKASIVWHSAFFIVQLSHPYMTTGKTIALTTWTLVGKVMSLLFNMLSRLVITFLPRSKRFLISLLQSLLQSLLEWVAISFSRGSSWARKWTWVSYISSRFFTIRATRETHFVLRYSQLTMMS